MNKKIFKILLILFVGLFGAAIAAPFLFKGKIIAYAKNEINQKLNATVDFSDISLSFLRHFPKATISMSDLQVIGKNEFIQDTLVAAKKIDATLNLMSIIKGGGYKIYSIDIDKPRIHALVSKEGKTNWDIVKPDSTTTAKSERKPWQLTLDSYSISNGYIKYEDASSNMGSEIINLNHSGKGDFTSDLFTLVTKTSADAVSFHYGKIPFLSKTKTSIDVDIQVDNKVDKYSFKTDKIKLNNLALNGEGFFQFLNDSVYNLDIKFNAPSNDFKNILSLVPMIYQKNFATVKTSGEASFEGYVKGKYSSHEIPAYALGLNVKNGFFQYPDLPKPVKNINITARLQNPDGMTDHTIINIPQGHIELENDPFDFRLLVKTPISHMFVDAAAKGKLNLSKITQYLKLEEGAKLSGLINADISVAGNLSSLDKKQFDQFKTAGNIDMNDFFYASKSYPDGVKIKTLASTFNPRNVTISNLAGEYLKTNFSANATIDNLIPYVFKNTALNGSMNIKADQMNLNDWMWTSIDSSSKINDPSPFAVPSNIDFVINAAVDKVHYDRVDLQNLHGQLVIKDETVKLNNIMSNALDGTIEINGSYSTKENKTKPYMNLSYDLKGLDVQKTFNAFNTVQKLMPIGKFISGKLSSQLSLSGKLGENMMPDLNTLTGNGNLFLIEGFLNKFAPLEKIASTLNVKELEAISVKDIKNFIEIANGKVLVKPFTVKVKDIDMEIGGMHGLDQSLDYIIQMKLPRYLLGNNGNALINNLANQVSNKGIPVKLGDFLNLKLTLEGTIANPKVKTDLKEAASSLADDMKQQAIDFANSKIDSTKSAVSSLVKDSLTSLKKQTLRSAGDEIKKQLLGKPDSGNAAVGDGKTKVIESAKGLLDNINPFKKKKTVATDSSKIN